MGHMRFCTFFVSYYSMNVWGIEELPLNRLQKQEKALTCGEGELLPRGSLLIRLFLTCHARKAIVINISPISTPEETPLESRVRAGPWCIYLLESALGLPRALPAGWEARRRSAILTLQCQWDLRFV